jgi:LacI family transcriptional regulator
MAKGKIAKSKITIDDIAAKAGVSIASVSRALNQEPGIGEKTRARILKLIKQLNYHPNAYAQGLATKTPNAIGIVSPRFSEFAFSNPFYTETIKGIENRAREFGKFLAFSFGGEKNYTQLIYQRLAAGLIVVGNRVGDPWLKKAQVEKIPLILIPGDPSQPEIPSVDFDNTEAGVKSVAHLLDLGHRKIGLINGSPFSKYSIDRLEGYKKKLIETHLPIREDFILYTDFTPEDAYLAMRKLLSLSDPPTAVLVINDHCVLGAMRAAREMKYRIPGDISIVGSGDVQLSTLTSPALTTIREPFYEIGRESADRLIKILQKKRVSPRHFVLPAELIIRNSTGPPGDGRRRGKRIHKEMGEQKQ